MLPDLPQFNCVHCLVVGRITKGIRASEISQLTNQSFRTNQSVMLVQRYNYSEAPHLSSVRFTRTSARTLEFALHIDWDPTQEPVTDEPTRVADIFAEISDRSVSSSVDFNFLFEFSEESAKQLFPSQFPIFGKHALDQIRGFRGVKFQGSRKSDPYMLSIESPDLKELYVDVEFNRRQIIHSEFLEQTLREAAGIARGMVPESERGH